MSDPSSTRAPRPRLTQAVVAAVLVMQAVFVWIGLSDGAAPQASLVVGDPLALAVTVGFAAYALAIAVFIGGIVMEAAWLRPLGIVAAIGGIGLALLRLGTGEPFDGLLFGMAIDALIVYGLQRPDIRALFPA